MILSASYTMKNLWARRVTAGLTVIGLGLVVFVFLGVLMLAHGLEHTLTSTGDPNNAIILRKGALSEIDSQVSREHTKVLASEPEVRLADDGRTLAVNELGLQLTLVKPGTNSLASLVLRGTSHESLLVRPKVRLTHGRLWAPGTTEVIVGKQVAAQFPMASLGRSLRFGQREWTVVGIFEADGSGFESEVWGDVEQFMMTFHRTAFTSMTVRLTNPTLLGPFKGRIEEDPRFRVTVRREPEFYEEKAKTLARMIRVTGLFLTSVFSVGAVLGATMTMSASVAQRTTEIGTLRTLGFTRREILQAFLTESAGLGLIGGVIGAIAASGLQFVTVSTLNMDSMSELAFRFRLTSLMIVQGVGFALIMSVVAGFFPAARAASLDIVQALGERTI